jgi:hypothetical protein
MKFALPGALALAVACASLSGCGAAQVAINAAAPPLETAACDIIESTAALETACVNVAGLLITVGEDLAAKLSPGSATPAIAATAAPAPTPASKK